MGRALVVVCLGLFGCEGDGSDDAPPSSSTEATGSTSGGVGSTSDPGTTADTRDPTTDAPSTSGSGGQESSGGATTGGADESSSGSSTGADVVVSFADIQADLENVGGAQGDYPSCIDGGPCHNNPDRNVVLVADPTTEQLMQNYQNILDAPGVPWVTPMDDSAQMLNEVPIPDHIRARWLAWIEAGAPFE